MRPIPSKGIYAITDGPRDNLLQVVEHALCGGVAMLQYRDLTQDDARRHTEARALAALCARHGVPLIIDHDVALARAVNADGVHLRQDESDPAAVRAELGADAIVGISCYASAELARHAANAGASYVSFGAFFPSPTKPAAGRATLEVLRQSATLGIPRVAIGGITPDNAGLLIDAGAEFVAVVSALFSSSDACATAKRLNDLMPCQRIAP